LRAFNSDATTNPMKFGKNKIVAAPNKLHKTERCKEYLRPTVSANTDVGISRSQIANVATLK